MTFLQTLPPDAPLAEVFQLYPASARPLLQLHETVMRGDSPLSVGQRELIAAYVSTLNACRYCAGIHDATAQRFGVDPAVLSQLLEDPATATIDEKLRPILAYVRKLTESPSRMAPADAEAVFAAGWDDRALVDAVSVAALFNFMNRLVEGLGIAAAEEYVEFSAQRLYEKGYAGLADELGLE